jgi:hypothetical protein
VACDASPIERELAQREAVHNLKRVVLPAGPSGEEGVLADPYRILETCEIKTTWHPIGE